MQKESEEYGNIRRIMSQLRVTRMESSKRTVTKKLALNALNMVNTCSTPTGEGRGAYV